MVTFPYAGLISRLVAFIIDVLIISAAILFTSAIIDLIRRFFRETGTSSIDELLRLVEVAFQFGVAPVYFIFLTAMFGQTVGKSIMGLRIVSSTGMPITFRQAFFRWLLQSIFVIGPMLFNYAWILVDSRRRAWHDLLTHTCVIYTYAPDKELSSEKPRLTA